MRKILIIGILIGMLFSCKQEPRNTFSFFVAGHTYGTPLATNPGLHPPFLKMFGFINDKPEIEFGIFTGDIVRESNEASWDSVKMQLKKLDRKVYFCPGNHDVKNRKIYEARFGDTYYSFTHKNNLFIILDGSLNRWNIQGPQLDFLRTGLEHAGDSIKNIFVFVHQLIWWDKANIFSQVNLNWPPYTPDTTNYWDEVEPMLQDHPCPVYIFAGDIGANRQADPIMYYPDRNITYVASGMGNIENDNFIIVRLTENNEVEIRLIALGPDHSKLGAIENYQLPKIRPLE